MVNPEKQLSPAIKPFKMICAGKKGRMLKNLKRPENRGLLRCLSRHWNSSFRLQRVPEQNLNMLNRFRLDLSGSSGNYQLRFRFEKESLIRQRMDWTAFWKPTKSTQGTESCALSWGRSPWNVCFYDSPCSERADSISVYLPFTW